MLLRASFRLCSINRGKHHVSRSYAFLIWLLKHALGKSMLLTMTSRPAKSGSETISDNYGGASARGLPIAGMSPSLKLMGTSRRLGEFFCEDQPVPNIVSQDKNLNRERRILLCHSTIACPQYFYTIQVLLCVKCLGITMPAW